MIPRTFRNELPRDNAEARRALYRGEIFHLEGTPGSRRLVAEVLDLLGERLGPEGPVREAQFRLSGGEFFRRIGGLRNRIYTEPRFHALLREVLADCGFEPERHAFEPIRLRVVADRGHENTRAAPIYYAHRDSWYGHSPSQISWWIALYDVTEAETFVFFTDYFQRPVKNDSGRFDFDEWVRQDRARRIGWQHRDTGREALYPQLQEDALTGVRLTFSSRAGQILLFSGQHLHQTRKHAEGRTRFSLDFRAVHLEDHRQGIGAPNVDNRSRGSALADYVHPA